MSKELTQIKEMAAAGCIREYKSVRTVIQNALSLTLNEIETATGRNLGKLEQYLIEDSFIYRDEDSPSLDLADFFELTGKMNGDCRLYYALHVTRIFGTPNPAPKWLRFFSEISAKAYFAFLKAHCDRSIKEIEKSFFKSAEMFKIEITNKTTIGDFIRIANSRVFKTWIPGSMPINSYEQSMKDGCRMIMDLFKGLGMLVTKQREPQRQKNAEMTEMYLDWVFEGKPLPEHITAALKK